jgi:urease accessory protein
MSPTGLLHLVARRKGNKTILADCYYEGAFKVTRPVYLEEDSPTLYLIHVGGGYVDGDFYSTNLLVEEGAEISVTTQSYTKVYKTPNSPVIQEMNIILKADSLLEYVPDPLIAYEGARYNQYTEVHMEEGACLFYCDIATPGWSEDGTPFQYDYIRSKLKVYKEEKLILFDHLWLEPRSGISHLMQMEQYTHMGTFIILHKQAGKDFGDQLYEHVKNQVNGGKIGISTLPENGVIMRMFAHDTRSIEKVIAYAHQYARKQLLEKSDLVLRK